MPTPEETIPIVALLRVNDASMGQYIHYGYDVSFLKQWGFKYIDFSKAGYTPLYLKDNSFSYIDFSNVGYTPQILEYGGFKYTDFSNVGYTPRMLESAGFKYTNFSNVGYTPQTLESAGFLYADFSNVGYTPQMLKSAGFKYTDFSNVGYTPQILESAGFLYADFSNVGYTPKMLESAGFTIKDNLHDITSDFSNISIITVPYLLSIGANYYWYEIFGYTPLQLLYPPNNFKYTDFLNAGYTPQFLKSAGFKLIDFSNAGYTPQLLESAGFLYADFFNTGYTPRYLKTNGFLYTDFSNTGYTPQTLESDGFKITDLSNIGYTIKELLYWHFRCSNFLNCGYTARDLFNYGFLKEDFVNNGWAVWNLLDASFIKIEYQNAGYSINDLQNQYEWNTNFYGIVNGFNSKRIYSNAGYSVKDLYFGNVKKNDYQSQYGFETLGYTVQDIIDAGLTNQLQQLGYVILDVSNNGFSKDMYDLAGFSVYDLLDNLSVNKVLSLGYSPEVVNSYRTFIYKVSTSKWDSFTSKKYPINNIINSFKDISFNNINDNSGNTIVTITWSSFIDYLTNDGLSLNPYTFCYYNEPTFIIKQFGGIPISRNSAINSNFFQFINFKGKIEAIDTPQFLPNTSLYRAFNDSTCAIFQQFSSWQTFQITDLRNLFFNSRYFKERIGNWNFSQIKENYMENIISGIGYNPIQTSIFLQDLSLNRTLNSDIYLGHIPPYYINHKTTIAINSLINRNISFDGSGIIADINSFKTKYTTFGYTRIEDLLVDTRIAGYSAIDISGYSLSQLHYAGYTISELNKLKINNRSKYTILDYYNNGFKLIDFIDSSYNVVDLSGIKTKDGFKVNDYQKIRYLRSDISSVFQVTELLIGNYTISDLKYIGYSAKEIALKIEYPIYDYTTAQYSLIDISGVVTSRNILYDSSYIYNKILTDNSANFFKSKNISSLDLKEFGFTISQIISMGYTLTDLHDASYTIQEIPNYLTEYADIEYTYAGYTLTDISNAGFPLQFTRFISQLPKILKDNKINVSDWKNINYTISQIRYYNYSLLEIRDNYTLSEIFNSNIYSVLQLKNVGYTSSQLLSVGYTLDKLLYIYTLDDLILSGYGIQNLRNAGYTITDFLNTLFLNDKSVTDKIIYLYSGDYSLLEFYQSKFSLRDVFNILYKFKTDKSLFMNQLLTIYPADDFIKYGFTAFDLYTLYDISLSIIQTINYPSTDIRSINSYKQYYINNVLPKPNKYSDISNISLLDLSNIGFTPDRLLSKIITTKTDISNNLAHINNIYSQYQNNTDLSNILQVNTSILPYNNDELISSTYPYEYNYSTMLPFGNTQDLSGTIINFESIYKYTLLFKDKSPTTFDYDTIYLYGYRFSFLDISQNKSISYGAINIYATGWLTFYNIKPDIGNNVDIVFSLRYLPFDLQIITVKYAFLIKSTRQPILEIIVNGKDIQGHNIQITIHIDNLGLITICNGDGQSNIYRPSSIRYSNPSNTLSEASKMAISYTVPMSYYYDSSNVIYPTFYDILRIDLRNQNYDNVTGLYVNKGIQTFGYLASELIRVYPLRQLATCFTVGDLKNLGYTAKTLYLLKIYNLFDIAVAYNIKIDILSILTYI